MEIIEKEVRGIATNNKVDTSKIQETPLYFDGMTRIGAKRLHDAKQKEFAIRWGQTTGELQTSEIMGDSLKHDYLLHDVIPKLTNE